MEKKLMLKRYIHTTKNMENGQVYFFGWMSVRIGINKKYRGKMCKE
jgi:hypothetical protein